MAEVDEICEKFTRIRMSGKMYYLESTTVSWRENISNLNWDSHDAREGERERERERESLREGGWVASLGLRLPPTNMKLELFRTEFP